MSDLRHIDDCGDGEAGGEALVLWLRERRECQWYCTTTMEREENVGERKKGRGVVKQKEVSDVGGENRAG